MPRLNRILALATAAGLLALGAPALADPPTVQPYAWRSVEILGGGFVSGVVYHPTEKGLVYARTDIGGAYRLDRATNAWVALNDGLKRADNQLAGALSLAVDPQDSRRLYMAAGEYTRGGARGGAVLASVDRGVTWTKAELPVKIGGNEDGRNTGERLMVDPHKGAVLLLGARDGLYRSADHGATWSRVEAFPHLHVTLVAFDPVEQTKTGETAIIYAGVAAERGGGVLVSTDGGVTWGLVNGQPKGLVPQHLAIDAKGVVYITYGNGLGPNGVTDGAVWKMDPDSGAWTDITPVKPMNSDVFGYGGLSLDPVHPGVVMVSTLDRWGVGDDVFRSLDGGKTWRALAASPPRDAGKETGRIALSADGQRMVWAMRRTAPYVSSDQGKTWRPVQGISPASHASNSGAGLSPSTLRT